MVTMFVRSLFGMILLRISCILYNHVFGRGEHSLEVAGADEFGTTDQLSTSSSVPSYSENPYRSPSLAVAEPVKLTLGFASNGVPIPSLKKAFWICVGIEIVSLICGGAIGGAAGSFGVGGRPWPMVLGLGALVIVICVLLAFVRNGLPTSWVKAAVVSVIFIALALLVASVVLLVTFGFFFMQNV